MTHYRIITSVGSVHEIDAKYSGEALKLAIEAMTGKKRDEWGGWNGWNAYAIKPQSGVQILDPASLITADAYDRSGQWVGGITVNQ